MTDRSFVCLFIGVISIIGLCTLYTLTMYYFDLLASKTKLLLPYSFKSKTDFILQISPRKKCRFKNTIRKVIGKNRRKKKVPHYPPPGYGIPPEKLRTFKKLHNLEKKDLPDKYHMILIPGGLDMWFFGMTMILSAIAIFPLVSLLSPAPDVWLSKPLLFTLMVVGIIVISLAFYKGLYAHMGRSVLSDIWAIWPEPCNHMLCSVPHLVKLSPSDHHTKTSPKLPPIYWNPKPQTPLFRQPRQYAPKIPTLQGVLLNFAIFDFFFHKKPKLSDHSNVLNVRRWAIYWMAPVWMSYLFLIICMVVYFWVSKTNADDLSQYLTSFNFPSQTPNGLLSDLIGKVIIGVKNQSFPESANKFLLKGGSFVIALIFWMISTAIFIHLHLAKMTALKDKVASGYFKSYENLVPQQILRRLTEIPEEQQIVHIIDQQRVFFHFLLFGAFVNFLLILDAFK